jgi:hypothetical protein
MQHQHPLQGRPDRADHHDIQGKQPWRGIMHLRLDEERTHNQHVLSSHHRRRVSVPARAISTRPPQDCIVVSGLMNTVRFPGSTRPAAPLAYAYTVKPLPCPCWLCPGSPGPLHLPPNDPMPGPPVLPMGNATCFRRPVQSVPPSGPDSSAKLSVPPRRKPRSNELRIANGG